MNDKIVLNKKYRITPIENKKIRTRVYKVDNDTLFLDKEQKKKISISDIQYIEKGRFSIVKTTVATVSSIFLFAIVHYIISPEIDVPQDVFHPLPN